MFKRLLMVSFALIAAFSIAHGIVEADTSGADEALEKLTRQGIISGFPDGTARLDENVTRAQAIVVGANLINTRATTRAQILSDLKNQSGAMHESPFSDLPPSHWAFDIIYQLYQSGGISGYPDGTFRPGEYVTYQEIAVIFGNALDLPLSVEHPFIPGASSWAQAYVAAALDYGFIPMQVDYTTTISRDVLVYAANAIYDQLVEQQLGPFSLNDYDETVYESRITLSGTKHNGVLRLGPDVIEGDASGNWSKEVELRPGSNQLLLTLNAGDDLVTRTLDIYYNTPPTIAPIADVNGLAYQTLSLQVEAEDADDDALLYTAKGLPDSMSIDAATGRISGQFTTSGTYQVSVTVAEQNAAGADRAVTQTFNWNIGWPVIYAPVIPVDLTPPVFVEFPAQAVLSGDTFHAAINESGWIYVVPASLITQEELDAQTLEEWAAAGTVHKLAALPEERIAIASSALTAANLYLYAVDGSGNVSPGVWVAVTVPQPEPEPEPEPQPQPEPEPEDTPMEIMQIVWHNDDKEESGAPYAHQRGVDLRVTLNKQGTVYFIDTHALPTEEGTINLARLPLVDAGAASSAQAEANLAVSLPTDKLAVNDNIYLVVAVDANGNYAVSSDTFQLVTVPAPNPDPDPEDVALQIMEIVWHNDDEVEDAPPYNHERGVDLLVTLNKTGSVYLIDISALPNEGDALDVANFPLIDPQFAASAQATANIPTSLSTDSLNGYGNYYFVVAVDEKGHYVMSSEAFKLFPNL